MKRFRRQRAAWNRQTGCPDTDNAPSPAIGLSRAHRSLPRRTTPGEGWLCWLSGPRRSASAARRHQMPAQILTSEPAVAEPILLKLRLLAELDIRTSSPSTMSAARRKFPCFLCRDIDAWTSPPHEQSPVSYTERRIDRPPSPKPAYATYSGWSSDVKPGNILTEVAADHTSSISGLA